MADIDNHTTDFDKWMQEADEGTYAEFLNTDHYNSVLDFSDKLHADNRESDDDHEPGDDTNFVDGTIDDVPPPPQPHCPWPTHEHLKVEGSSVMDYGTILDIIYILIYNDNSPDDIVFIPKTSMCSRRQTHFRQQYLFRVNTHFKPLQPSSHSLFPTRR